MEAKLVIKALKKEMDSPVYTGYYKTIYTQRVNHLNI